MSWRTAARAGFYELRHTYGALVLGALLGALGPVTDLYPHSWRAWFYLPSLGTYAAVALYSVALMGVWWRWSLRRADSGWVHNKEAWSVLRKQRKAMAVRLSHVVAAFLATALIMNVFGGWKLSIGADGFRWELEIARLNSWLHSGVPEWRIATMLPAEVVWALDRSYYLWLSLLAIGLCYQAWRTPSLERARFWLAFALSWLLLGGVIATVFGAAGPVYYSRTLGIADPYGDLWASLASADRLYGLITPNLQEVLWRARLTGSANPYAAISAFPSMHVAIPFLFALSLWSASRPASCIAGLYTAIVLIGSVVLGWHYAIDGYASLLGVAAIWWAAGWFLAVRQERAPT